MRRFAALTLVVAQALAASAFAGTDSTTFDVKLVITESCDIHTTRPTEVDFGTRARVSGPVSISANGSITVNCSAGTAYKIGLDGGNNAGATPSAGDRRMAGQSNGALVPYDLYQDAALAIFWGNAGTALLSSTGTGINQVFPVYGRLTSLNYAADSYLDTITATVTY